MKTAPRTNRELFNMLVFPDGLFVFANLIANRAGSLACRLAGSRALSAASGTQRFVDHCFIDGLNMFFHFKPSLDMILYFTLFLPNMQGFYYKQNLRKLCLIHSRADPIR